MSQQPAASRLLGFADINPSEFQQASDEEEELDDEQQQSGTDTGTTDGSGSQRFPDSFESEEIQPDVTSQQRSDTAPDPPESADSGGPSLTPYDPSEDVPVGTTDPEAAADRRSEGLREQGKPFQAWREQLIGDNPGAVEAAREEGAIMGPLGQIGSVVQLQGAAIFDNEPVFSVQDNVRKGVTAAIDASNPGVEFDERDLGQSLQDFGGAVDAATDAPADAIDATDLPGSDSASWALGGLGDELVDDVTRTTIGQVTGINPQGDDPTNTDTQPGAITTGLEGLGLATGATASRLSGFVGGSDDAASGTSRTAGGSGSDGPLNPGAVEGSPTQQAGFMSYFDEIGTVADDAGSAIDDVGTVLGRGDGGSDELTPTEIARPNEGEVLSPSDIVGDGATSGSGTLPRSGEVLSPSDIVSDGIDNIAESGSAIDGAADDLLDNPARADESARFTSTTDTAVDDAFPELGVTTIDEPAASNAGARQIVGGTDDAGTLGSLFDEAVDVDGRLADDLDEGITAADEPRPDNIDLGPARLSDDASTFADEGDTGLNLEGVGGGSARISDTRLPGRSVDGDTPTPTPGTGAADESYPASAVDRAPGSGAAGRQTDRNGIGPEGSDAPAGGFLTSLRRTLGGGVGLGALAGGAILADELFFDGAGGAGNEWTWGTVATLSRNGWSGAMLEVRRSGETRGFTIITSDPTIEASPLLRLTRDANVTQLGMSTQNLDSGQGSEYPEPIFDSRSQARSAWEEFADRQTGGGGGGGGGSDPSTIPESRVWDGSLDGPREADLQQPASYDVAVQNTTEQAQQTSVALLVGTDTGEPQRVSAVGSVSADPGGSAETTLTVRAQTWQQLGAGDYTLLLAAGQGRAASQNVTVQGADDGGADDPWTVTRVQALDAGWTLYRRDHREESRTQWGIVGKDGDGTVLSLTESGTVNRGGVTWHDEQQTALAAYQAWLQEESQGGHSDREQPDPNAPAPSEQEVKNASASSGGTVGRLLNAATGVPGLLVLGVLAYAFYASDGSPLTWLQSQAGDISDRVMGLIE